MSDFDKEAEREKLREKYEQDKEEREATQRMSDLLLKGATMTNAHCGTCGDPLFQHDGTTFCPSCHGNPEAVEGTDLEARPADGEAASEQPAADRSPAEQSTTDGPADDGRIDGAATDATSAVTPDTADAEADSTATAASDSTTVRHGRTDGESDDRRVETDTSSDESAPRPASASSRRAPAASPPPVDGDLEVARDALVRTLEKFAAEAAAADDPRYARDCLEAAREAGETLSTLR